MTEVWCVLRSGGDYMPQHVTRLAGQVTLHGGGRLHCLTDIPWAVADAAQVAVEPMHWNWPGWFSKLELFTRPGPILYLDLDSNIVDSLALLMEIAATNDFVVARNWNSHSAKHVISSAVMGWRSDVSALHDAFAVSSAANMELYGNRHRWQEPGRGWGDQGFIRDHWRGERWAFWQELAPGALEHFKYGDPSRAQSVIVSGGKPRPWDAGGADEWLRARGVQV